MSGQKYPASNSTPPDVDNAKRLGHSTGEFGTLRSTFSAQNQHVTSDMPATVKIRKGLDIRLKGGVQGASHDLPASDRFSIHPTDFHGLVPRMAVKAGAEVKAGDVLFTDKKNPEIKFVSGIAGTVQEPVRGEKRRILRVDVVPSGSGVISGATIDPTQPDGDAVRAAHAQHGFLAHVATTALCGHARFGQHPPRHFREWF